MTEPELNNALLNNKVTLLPSDEPDSDQIVSTDDLALDENEPVITSTKTPRKHLPAPPNFTPHTFVDSIQYFSNGSSKFPYFFIDNEWVQATNTGLLPIAFVDNLHVSDVEIDVDITSGTQYHIFLNAWCLEDEQSTLILRLNNSSSSIYYGRSDINGGIVDFSAETKIQLNAGFSDPRTLHSNIVISKTGLYTNVQATTTTAGVTTKLPTIETSGWNFATASDISTLNFSTQSTNQYYWTIKVYKLI